MASRPVPSFVPALKGCVNILPDSIERDWGWLPSPGSRDAADLVIREPIIQEFIFDSCGLNDACVIEARKLEDHTVYVIQVSVGDYQWLVSRRYREFDELHELLVKYYNVEKKLLPPKKIFRSNTEYYTSLRKVKLDQYLKRLIKTFTVPPLELLKFLNYMLYDVISVTQYLSSKLHSQCDSILASRGYISLTPVQVYCINRRLQIPVKVNCSHDEGDIAQLYDLFYQLQKLKIAPALNQLVTLTAQAEVDLTPFKSLLSLRLEAVEVEKCSGLEMLYTQLNCLEVYRCKSDLWKFLLVDSKPLDGVKGQPNDHVDQKPDDMLGESLNGVAELTESLIERSCPWPHLRHFVFKYNNLERIDESLKLTPYLEELDLSHNVISLIENLTELTQLAVLDLSYNQINRLDQLSSKLGNISKLSLAHNLITTLEGLKKMFSLTYLNLSQNSIVEIKEVENLSSLDCLEQLLLKDNPLTSVNDYRIKVFSSLPNIWKQLSLDGIEATSEEMEVIEGQPGGCGGDDVTDSQQRSQLLLHQQQQHKRSPKSSKKMKSLSEEEDVNSLSRAAVLKSKMAAMRKEGGNKWLAMLNAEKEEHLHKISPHKMQKKSKSSKKKMRERDSWEKNETEVLAVETPPPSPPPPLFQKCSLLKPSLDCDVVHKFIGQLAAPQEASGEEVLLHILWCSCVHWSSPDYEKDVGVFITSKCVHILYINDTYKSSLSWETENLPLSPFRSIPFTKVKQVVVGLFKQSLRIEISGLENTVVLLTRDADRTISFSDTLKAAMDADNIKYSVLTTSELQQQRITGDDCTFLMLDEMDEDVLRRQLVQDEIIDQVSAQSAISYSTSATVSTEEDLQGKIITAAEVTDVCGYFSVSLMQDADKEFYHRTLIITNKKVIMCDEDHLHWPPPLSMNVIPTTNKIQVLLSEPFSNISKLEVCHQPHLVKGTRDRVYEVFLLFVHVGEFAEKSQTGWYFLLQGFAELQLFISTMESIFITLHYSPDSLWSELSSRYATVDIKNFSPITCVTPNTDSSHAVMDKIEDLADVTCDKQQEYFHKHISQFPHQENIKLTFSCTCIPFTAPNLNLQVFTFISTRAVYLLTDPHSMKLWVEGGGKCPFTSYSYSDLQHSNRPVCFQYVTFQQLKDVSVGLFFQYFRISGGNASNTFTFMTQRYDLTNAFLEALPSNHRQREDSVDDSFTQLLAQYSVNLHKTNRGRPYSTPLPLSPKEDPVLFKISYLEPTAILSILSETQHEPIMILKYLIVKLKSDTTEAIHSMVLTNREIYIVKEDFIQWPTPPFVYFPSGSQYSILMSCSLHNIVRIETKRRQTSNFTVVCKGNKLKLSNEASAELSDDDSLVSELMQSIKIDKEVKRISRLPNASLSAVRGLTTWHLSLLGYEERERFLQVLATAYEDVKKEKLLVTSM